VGREISASTVAKRLLRVLLYLKPLSRH
jgi:hypothetical protein